MDKRYLVNEHRGGDDMNSSTQFKSWLTDWANNDENVKPLLNNLESNKRQCKAKLWIEDWMKNGRKNITE